jgi:HlyD family secretion protein
MPAEVYITTPQRSLLAYLLEPIDAFRQRALREP